MVTPTRFYLLDALRGLAALGVVVFHYQNFFFTAPNMLPADFEPLSQPFSEVLGVFYLHGSSAVQLFFVLSGTVFFHVYAQSLASGKTSGYQFFVMRFSRLYPLHLATLLLVAVGQYSSAAVDGQFTVYPNNDALHFAQNLLFASHWGWQTGGSFNAPIWSVSVEVLLYVLFYLFAVSVLPRMSGRVLPVAAVCVLTFAGLASVPEPVLHIAVATVCFFLGGLAFVLIDGVRHWPTRRHAMLMLAAVVVASAGLHGGVTSRSPLPIYFVTFPAAIFALGLLQFARPTLGIGFKVIGDITYSTYLIHFPIQLVALLIIKSWGLTVDFNQPLPFVAYLAAVVGLAIPTFHLFEVPAQSWVRRRLLQSSVRTSEAVALAQPGALPR